MNPRFFRLLGLGAALPFACALGACHSGSGPGATNVERGSDKKVQPEGPQANARADSATSGKGRATNGGPSGKKVFENSGQATDNNHDGVAD